MLTLVKRAHHITTEECVLKLSLHDTIGAVILLWSFNLMSRCNLLHLSEFRLIFAYLRGISLAGMTFLPSLTTSRMKTGRLLTAVVLSSLHFMLKPLTVWDKETSLRTIRDRLALILASRCI